MSILAECPVCHKRQANKNKVCSCGQNMDKLKPGGKVNYWIVNRLDGKQKWENAGTSIEEARDADGKRKVQKRENRIFEILPQATMTFQELSDWYMKKESVKAKKYYPLLCLCLKKFNADFGTRIVADIKTGDLEDYQAKRKGQGKAASTIDQEIAAAKAVVNQAFKDDKVGGNILKTFQNVKKFLTGKKLNSNARKRTLSPDEFQTLVESASGYYKPILWMGYDTGMREAEIYDLTWAKVSLKDRVIRLKAEDTKDSEPREIPLSQRLHDILSRLPRGIQDDYPVFTRFGKLIKDARTVLRNACEEAKILYGRFKDGGFVFHDLRRTFTTDMRKAGVQESVIMEITGHARHEVFDRYNQIDLEDKRRAIEKLVEYRDENAKVSKSVSRKAFLNEKRANPISANPSDLLGAEGGT